jgi:predicted CXXCH cytochrome family protein
MLLGTSLLVLFLLALLLFSQARRALGTWRGTVLAALVVLLFGSAWGALDWARRHEPLPPEDPTTLRPVPSQACFKCHESHYTSWQATFHRTMTREATPENVKADFDNAAFRYAGVTSHMLRHRDSFFIETVDPQWAELKAPQGLPRDRAGLTPRRLFSVDRLVGSHWFQQMLHRDEYGRYLRLPLIYHLVERRWIHIDGAFLAPESGHFYNKVGLWNENCVFCHNTRVNKNPQPLPLAGQEWPAYATQVGELGISCEACHGAAERHVLAQQNPSRRLAQHSSSAPDPTIVNPARLSVPRSDDVCAHCHSGPRAARAGGWNSDTQADPFLAGRELGQFFFTIWTEAQLHRLRQGQEIVCRPERPEALDGRFWGDGTPLTTALEYQGLALSACYQGGHGELRCLSCHSMHQGDRNHQVKDGMRTNAACYGCHDSYRQRLTEHTHHAADSPGSLCSNCHMPYQVYSLLTTHRSHRIAIPRVRDSLGTGKPHACNLCHLDRSLGWTQEQLHKWYGTRPESLSDDDRTLASSLVHLAGSDARSRAVVAGAFSWPPAQQASGRDWPVLLLTRLLQHERYPAVRYLEHRALRSLRGPLANDYDYLASPAERAAQLDRLRLKLESTSRPDRGHYPCLPLTAEGRFDDNVLERLLRRRNDPDVSINE